MSKVRKAVIPAAGLGTRFLPASKSQPKEMIPLVDKPAIQYAVEEAARVGITDVLIITSENKSSLEDHFNPSEELEEHLEKAGKHEALEDIRRIPKLAKIQYVLQDEPLGFGHAVSLAKPFAGDEPFAVLVPDEVVPEPRNEEVELMQMLIEGYEKTAGSVIAVQEVPMEEISSYGVITPKEGRSTEWIPVADMVEKPPADRAPSNLAAVGRYVFTPEIFAALEQTAPGAGGEIQLTDAIKRLAQRGSVYAYVTDGPVLDVGKKLDYLKATVELALRREDLSKPFKDWLVDLVAHLD